LVHLTAGVVLSAYLPGDHHLDVPFVSDQRLPSNSIIDIRPYEGILWLGTGQGLAKLDLTTGLWGVIDQSDGLGRGGVSALAVTDTIIWAATAYSEKVDDSWYPAGGGVGFSRDGGVIWHWMPQPVDPADVEDYDPTTTHIQNVTYDLALSDSAVWTASYGGGLRKLRYENILSGSYRWEVVPPDTLPFSAWLHLNHRAFSVVYADGLLWVGTAAGVNRSYDGGLSWRNFSHRSGGMSGNFVTALAVQEVGDRTLIWAATWKAEGGSEYYGISVTDDDGQSWRVALSDSTELSSGDLLIDIYGSLRVHNIDFQDSSVYAAADGGLWISHDLGYTWGEGPLESVSDPTIGERLSGVDFFSAAAVGDSLWVGTDDGLAVGWFETADSAFTWRIHRAHQPPATPGQPETYAYPSPFSPQRGQFTRFQIPVFGPIVVSFEVYNFAMERVYKSVTVTLCGDGEGDMTGYGAVQWNGRDQQGSIVANGVYFYRMRVAGNTWWGKVMVLD